MASFNIIVALVSAMFGIFVCLQLALSFLPPVYPSLATGRFYSNSTIQNATSSNTSDIYLVGAGKADITGWVTPRFDRSWANDFQTRCRD